MKVYRFTFTAEDEIAAENPVEAFKKAKELLQLGYYGPTLETIEFVRDIEAEEPGTPAD